MVASTRRKPLIIILLYFFNFKICKTFIGRGSFDLEDPATGIPDIASFLFAGWIRKEGRVKEGEVKTNPNLIG